MERHEYAYLYGYTVYSGVSNSNVPGNKSANAFIIQSAESHLLKATGTLSALNEVGADGWIVWSSASLGGSTSLSSRFQGEIEQRLGWRPNLVTSDQMFSLRRRLDA